MNKALIKPSSYLFLAAVISAVILWLFTLFFEVSLVNERQIFFARIVFILIHLYPTNVIAAYLVGANMNKHFGSLKIQEIVLVWLPANIAINIATGPSPILSTLSLVFLIIGSKTFKNHAV